MTPRTCEMAEVLNLLNCHVPVWPEDQADAVVAEHLEGADRSAIEAIARLGACEADLDRMREIIERYKLDCTVEQCADALVRYCRKRVKRWAEDEALEREGL